MSRGELRQLTWNELIRSGYDTPKPRGIEYFNWAYNSMRDYGYLIQREEGKHYCEVAMPNEEQDPHLEAGTQVWFAGTNYEPSKEDTQLLGALRRMNSYEVSAGHEWTPMKEYRVWGKINERSE